METKELSKSIQKLSIAIERATQTNSLMYIFIGGIMRGAGLIVGATALIIIGTAVLNLVGLLPGFSDIAQVIADAFAKTQLR